MHPLKTQLDSITTSLIAEDWSALATLMGRINLMNIKNKKTRYSVIFAKGVLNAHLQSMNGSGTINASLLVGMLKMIMRLENEFGGTGHEFLILAKTIAKKFETQKLTVNKALEKKLEFKKMKGVIES